MNVAVSYGDGDFLADKSAWVRAHREATLQAEWAHALANDQIGVCSVTRLEILYSAQTAQQYEQWDEALSALRNVAVTQTVSDTALGAMRELAMRSDGYHRISPPDYLIAAAAQDVGCGVLHYDHDFDRLAEVLNFESRWIAAASSIP